MLSRPMKPASGTWGRMMMRADLGHRHDPAHLLAHLVGRPGERHQIHEAIRHELAVTRGGGRVLEGVVPLAQSLHHGAILLAERHG